MKKKQEIIDYFNGHDLGSYFQRDNIVIPEIEGKKWSQL